MLKRLKNVTYGTLKDRPEEPEPKHKKSLLVKSVPKLALHYTVLSGKAVLYVIDTMGEWLAEFFGIIPPLEWYLEEEERRQGVPRRSGQRESSVGNQKVEETCLVEDCDE